MTEDTHARVLRLIKSSPTDLRDVLLHLYSAPFHARHKAVMDEANKIELATMIGFEVGYLKGLSDYPKITGIDETPPQG